VQTFRSVIPESVVGSVSAPTFETYGGAIDLKFKTGTYVGLIAQAVSADVDQQVGVFDLVSPVVAQPSSTRQRLAFNEYSAGLSLNQLISKEWSCGLSYRFTSSQLNSQFADIKTAVYPGANDISRSDLHHLSSFVLFSHPSGFFAGAEADWYAQDNTLRTHDRNGSAVEVDLPSDAFPQFNLSIGWRFPRQLGDVTFGVLNVGGSDYHLNPLNSYPELPHERVYAGQVRLRF
jgi:hypothetical protein